LRAGSQAACRASAHVARPKNIALALERKDAPDKSFASRPIVPEGAIAKRR
jgi:hypothetical protein